MARIVIIGNSGGGKSTLARKLAGQTGLGHVEIDRLLWQPGWRLTPTDIYNREHDRIVAGDDWIIEGLGRQDSIPRRIARASVIVLIDLPLWIHFWLAADRQIAWATGAISDAPAGINAMPSTRALFENIWEVERAWMPEIRTLCVDSKKSGKPVFQITSLEALTEFDSNRLMQEP